MKKILMEVMAVVLMVAVVAIGLPVIVFGPVGGSMVKEAA